MSVAELVRRTITLREVAEICRTSKKTARRWSKEGILPPGVELGHQILFDREAIEKRLSALTALRGS
jgi:predicted site-specific integrase-resolvase